MPAGRVEGTETPLETARRELLEETGYQSDDWELLGSCVRSTNQHIATEYVFRPRNAVKTQEPCSGDLEDARVELLTRCALIEAVRSGEVKSAPVLAAIALMLLKS